MGIFIIDKIGTVGKNSMEALEAQMKHKVACSISEKRFNFE